MSAAINGVLSGGMHATVRTPSLPTLHVCHARSEKQPRSSTAGAFAGRSPGKNNGRMYGKDASLGLPFTKHVPNLPRDGEIMTDDEKLCNPETRNCPEPMFVYEQKCKECCGTGVAVSRGRRHNVYHTCILCAGVGFVRHVTSRYEPECNGSLDGPTIMGRDKTAPQTGQESKKREYGDWSSN